MPLFYADGSPAGFCGEPAYGKRPPCEQYYCHATQRMKRVDGRYNGHVPDLACPKHGGPEPRWHFGDPCIHCGVAHDDVPIGPCAAAMKESDDA